MSGLQEGVYEVLVSIVNSLFMHLCVESLKSESTLHTASRQMKEEPLVSGKALESF